MRESKAECFPSHCLPERDFDETIDAVLRRFNVVLNEWLELLDQSVQKDEEVIDMRTFKQVMLNAESIIEDLRQLEPSCLVVGEQGWATDPAFCLLHPDNTRQWPPFWG